MSARNIIILIATLTLALPSTAAAQWVSGKPTISGTAREDSILTSSTVSASGSRTGYVWLRCEPNNTNSCKILEDQQQTTYKLIKDDVGKRMKVARWAVRGDNWDYEISDPTAVVAAKPAPTPAPTPPKATPVPTPPRSTPTPSPTPSTGGGSTGTVGGTVGTPTPTPPTFEVTPEPQPAPPAATPVPNQVLGATETKKKAKMLKPFPVVRVSGRLTLYGANIERLTVKAAKGVKITVTCKGKGCPRKRLAKATRMWHLSQFERELRAGVKLTITISKPGYISKVTTLRIRQGKAPLRSDMCRVPGAKKISRCPS